MDGVVSDRPDVVLAPDSRRSAPFPVKQVSMFGVVASSCRQARCAPGAGTHGLADALNGRFTRNRRWGSKARGSPICRELVALVLSSTPPCLSPPPCRCQTTRVGGAPNGAFHGKPVLVVPALSYAEGCRRGSWVGVVRASCGAHNAKNLQLIAIFLDVLPPLPGCCRGSLAALSGARRPLRCSLASS